MTEEKVETTTTEETKTEETNAGADVKVETEKTVERSSEEKSEVVTGDSTDAKETNVNVSIDQTVSPSAQPQPDPHKNYEAAQPIIDPIV